MRVSRSLCALALLSLSEFCVFTSPALVSAQLQQQQQPYVVKALVNQDTITSSSPVQLTLSFGNIDPSLFHAPVTISMSSQCNSSGISVSLTSQRLTFDSGSYRSGSSADPLCPQGFMCQSTFISASGDSKDQSAVDVSFDSDSTDFSVQPGVLRLLYDSASYVAPTAINGDINANTASSTGGNSTGGGALTAFIVSSSSPSHSHSSTLNTWQIVVIALACGFMLVLFTVFTCCCYRRMSLQHEKRLADPRAVEPAARSADTVASASQDPVVQQPLRPHIIHIDSTRSPSASSNASMQSLQPMQPLRSVHLHPNPSVSASALPMHYSSNASNSNISNGSHMSNMSNASHMSNMSNASTPMSQVSGAGSNSTLAAAAPVRLQPFIFSGSPSPIAMPHRPPVPSKPSLQTVAESDWVRPDLQTGDADADIDRDLPEYSATRTNSTLTSPIVKAAYEIQQQHHHQRNQPQQRYAYQPSAIAADEPAG